MAYNQNYYNPYAQYPYSAYNGTPTQQPNMNYQQPVYQQPQYQQSQVQQQPQQPQQQYFPFTFVNGIEGAKAFIVQPNQVYYLKDVDSNLLFEKKLDNQGKPILTAFETKPINIQDIGKKPTQEPKIDLSDYVSKRELNGYATIDDFSKLNLKLDNALDRLSRQIDTLNARGGRNYNTNNNNSTPQQNSKKENE